MILDKIYQNSSCISGYLHNFYIIKNLNEGSIEICEKCHKKKFFKVTEPSRIYLSYHLRSAIQPNNPRFNHEYPHIKL